MNALDCSKQSPKRSSGKRIVILPGRGRAVHGDERFNTDACIRETLVLNRVHGDSVESIALRYQGNRESPKLTKGQKSFLVPKFFLSIFFFCRPKATG